MNTCVSMKCPFILYCKKYNFLIDRGGRCETQEAILRAASEMISGSREKRDRAPRANNNGGICNDSKQH